MRLTLKQYHELMDKRDVILPVKANKYNAKACVIDGFRFDSIAEGDYYKVLKWLVRVGEVLYFLRQVTFHLPGNVRMVLDFMVVYPSGQIRYVDVKGAKPTEAWTVKRKGVEALYPIVVDIVKKRDVTFLKQRYGLS